MKKSTSLESTGVRGIRILGKYIFVKIPVDPTKLRLTLDKDWEK